MKRIVAISFFLLSFAHFSLAQAQVVINEIMYDLEGADTGREWIEVHNTGSEVDLTEYKFFESGTNHGLVFDSGANMLASGGYAVIVSDPAKFKSDWPSFSGTIFDSSFSLDNTGESLAIKRADLSVIDEYTYSSDLGAVGDGKSLQKVNGSWINSLPTPGKENTSIQNTNSDTKTADADNTLSAQSSSSMSMPTSKKKNIEVEILAKQLAFTGLPLLFSSKVYGQDGEELISGKLFWNFGDGSSKTIVLPFEKDFEHIYYYAGEYLVSLEYYQDLYSTTPLASNEILINTAPATVIISSVGNEVDFFVELKNISKFDIDLTGWNIVTDNESFTFPKNSIILAGKTMILGSRLTGLKYANLESLKLISSSFISVFDYGASIKLIPTTQKTSLPQKDNFASITTNSDPSFDFFAENGLDTGKTNSIISNELSANTLETESTQNSSFMFLFGLLLVITLGAGAIYFIRQKKNKDNEEDDFELIDS